MAQRKKRRKYSPPSKNPVFAGRRISKAYSPKQINYFIRITKDIKKLKLWQSRKEKAEMAILKSLNKLEQKMNTLKRENAKLKAQQKRDKQIKWAQQQGIDLNKNLKGEMTIPQKAKTQIKQIQKTISQKENIIDYLKPNTISEIRTNFTRFQESENDLYSELLDKAMQNPTEFKTELINQIEKLKNLIEVEIKVWGTFKGQIIEKASLTTRGHTIKEIKELMTEYGITPGAIINSKQWQSFANALETGNWDYTHIDSEITNLNFNIRIMRGK